MPKEEGDIQEVEKPEGTPQDLMEDSEDILKQIKDEYKISEQYKKTYSKKWIRQMKMMNNEKLNTEKIGDETMWTIFNTVQSSLDNDKLAHDFVPTEKGDEETCELMNALATHDYNKMNMESTERMWTYWTLFAGRAVIDQRQYNEKILSCSPKYINPYLEYVDPRAISMHGVGIEREGSARWYGYELMTTAGAMRDIGIEVEKTTPLKSKAIDDMNASDGKKTLKASGDNEDVVLFEWYTRFDSKNIYCLVDQGMKKIYRVQVLEGNFPLADRSTNISPLSWYPRSVPDLLEDKHRARANVLNTSIDIVREQLKPIYQVKEGSVRLDLLENAEAGDIIEVENMDSIRPIQKQSITQDVDWILNQLDSSAQEATATPDIQQGVMAQQQRTASELNLIASGSKNRYGMTARIFGASMRKFWENWYESLQEYFNESVHKKMIRIAGVYGPSWRTVKKTDITLAGDLDIRIESKAVNDQKQAIELNGFVQFHTIASKDPNYDVREGIKIIGKKSGISTQEINFLLRKTTDEMEAEEENKLLDQNKLTDGKKGAMFNIQQDHDAHIREHMKGEMTKAKEAHIEMHYEAKMFAKNNPNTMAILGQGPTDQQQAQANTQSQTVGQMVAPNNQPLGLPTL